MNLLADEELDFDEIEDETFEDVDQILGYDGSHADDSTHNDDHNEGSHNEVNDRNSDDDRDGDHRSVDELMTDDESDANDDGVTPAPAPPPEDSDSDNDSDQHVNDGHNSGADSVDPLDNLEGFLGAFDGSVEDTAPSGHTSAPMKPTLDKEKAPKPMVDDRLFRKDKASAEKSTLEKTTAAKNMASAKNPPFRTPSVDRSVTQKPNVSMKESTNRTEKHKSSQNKGLNVEKSRPTAEKPRPAPDMSTPAIIKSKTVAEKAKTSANMSMPIIKPKPGVEKTKPVVEKPKQSVEKTKHVSEKPKPVSEKPKPVSEKPKPVAENPKPIAEKTQLIVEKSIPSVDKPKPVPQKHSSVVENVKPLGSRPGPASSKLKLANEKPRPDVLKTKQIPEVSKAKPMPEVSKAKPMPEVSKAKPMPEVSKAKPMPEVSKAKPMPEVSKAKPMPEVLRAKPILPKPVIEKPKLVIKSPTRDRVSTEKLNTYSSKESHKPIDSWLSMPSGSKETKVSKTGLTGPVAPIVRGKTTEADIKFYESLRIYLKTKRIIGYEETTFKEDAKNFKVKHNVLFMRGREVIESEQRMRDLSVEYHLNAKVKSSKSRHRGAKATATAIKNKYFWPTIDNDVKDVINRCIVCNPREYALTTFQLWKYIEIGVIDSILVVRDLSSKSSIFNCGVCEDLSARKLCYHLLNLFQQYGIPNAIRVVLPQFPLQFVQELKECFQRELTIFIESIHTVCEANEDAEEVFSLPKVNITMETGDDKCPENDKQLFSSVSAISANENKWLIPDTVYDSISRDINNFVNKVSDWEQRMSALTLHFQINGTNLKANEVEVEPEVNTPKEKKGPNYREVLRLQSDMKTSNPSKPKRQPKPKADDDYETGGSSDSEMDISGDSSDDHISKRRARVRQNSDESNDSHKPKIEVKKTTGDTMRHSIDTITVDDSSNSQSASSHISAISSTANQTSNRETPEPLVPESNDVLIYDTDDDAIAGDIDFDQLFAKSTEEEDKDAKHSAAIESIISFLDDSVSDEHSKDTPSAEASNKKSEKKSIKTKVLKKSNSSEEDDRPVNEITPKTSHNSTSKQTTSSMKTSQTGNKRKKESDDDLGSDYDDQRVATSSTKSKTAVKRVNKTPNTTKKAKTDEKPRKRKARSESSDSSASETVDKSAKNSAQNKENETLKEVFVYHCEYCNFSTNEKHNLLLHSGGHKTESKTKLYCSVCFGIFYHTDRLEQHMIEQHPLDIKHTILYGCSVNECKGVECESIAQLDQHLHQHIETVDYLKPPKYRCNHCNQFTASTEEQVFAHLSQKHRSFKCAFNCPFTGPDYLALERHAKSSHSRYGKPFVCKFCDFSCAVFGGLIQHHLSAHAIDWNSGRNKCCLCEHDFDFEDLTSLLDHLVKHSPDFGYFECKPCRKRITKFEPMKIHLKTHHAVGADEVCREVANLKDLFDDLLLKIKERNHQKNSYTAPKETENAIAGLMGEEFNVGYDNHFNGAVDPLADAMNQVFNEEFNGYDDNPEIHIAETEDNGLLMPNRAIHSSASSSSSSSNSLESRISKPLTPFVAFNSLEELLFAILSTVEALSEPDSLLSMPLSSSATNRGVASAAVSSFFFFFVSFSLSGQKDSIKPTSSVRLGNIQKWCLPNVTTHTITMPLEVRFAIKAGISFHTKYMLRIMETMDSRTAKPMIKKSKPAAAILSDGHIKVVTIGCSLRVKSKFGNQYLIFIDKDLFQMHIQFNLLLLLLFGLHFFLVLLFALVFRFFHFFRVLGFLRLFLRLLFLFHLLFITTALFVVRLLLLVFLHDNSLRSVKELMSQHLIHECHHRFATREQRFLLSRLYGKEVLSSSAISNILRFRTRLSRAYRSPDPRPTETRDQQIYYNMVSIVTKIGAQISLGTVWKMVFLRIHGTHDN
ncbi:unnamed protein product [Medioppia subpectinata]|uniref:C2H2-type domain-containing protein n=1 Tax=Medioppia subpectinata TaxID=1979941 RepID=A0A7R9KE27_9ACAR|nr:unnamed protein product [Medioppia subpectinata]CAG2101636.1 unnamed protein product [Medioppia subpectinata]